MRRTLAPRGDRTTLPLTRTRDPLDAIGETAREILVPRFAWCFNRETLGAAASATGAQESTEEST